ncbi:SMP-30/Gluconolaconase/LRE-like region [Posidoniimonas polymericola]|uniref:SMP-30/Gluconolaconase/LRE-like region n=1 Tax=Posidoniimonas polymericola TaxID=2528002 RepID=A0A5C5YQX9_9BACT|nr:hypothetical protein [Posidoniimonas polymericola]TWT77325.1 SMP-30/Gluconolaconase/LRE-like region [Posidoniimonas polymericola]
MRSSAKLLCGMLALLVIVGGGWLETTLLAEEEAANDAAQPMIRLSVPAVVVTPAVAGQADQAAACDAKTCENEACEDEACEVHAGADAQPAADQQAAVARPTHKQTKVISINPSDLTEASLKSFCLTPDGTVLAACVGDGGEVRLFSADGEFQTSWSLPVDPEAINVGSDGNVYVAGDGKLLRLDASGKVLLEADGPHINEGAERREEVKQQIIEQQKKSVESYSRMSKQYDDRLAKLKEQKAELEEADEEAPEALDVQIANAERMVKQWADIVKQLGGAEMTEEQLNERVTASLQSSAAVASISEAAGEVFVATREAAGYGFCVWKMDHQFAGGEVITTGLRGCCGQMDVQCCENGVYVAENSRHRVYHLSTTGEELGEWGHGAREGLEGFGSCCNPMNVAIGPERTVYTAESGTGRIKRYTPGGELIELVGKVDIVPGCKKVSIAVDKSGDRVYMLDITRDHIVLMERLTDGEESEYTEVGSVEASAKAAMATGSVDVVETF